jgi:hypothetical protein
MEYNVRPNEDVFIRIQLAKTDTGLYPQAKIYAIDAPTTVVATVNLAEIGNGLYGLVWTNNGEVKKYFTQTIVYTDSGYTSEHPIIRPDSDSINVGFTTTGGVFGKARSGGVVHTRTGLTKEEIDRIVRALFEKLKPELDKKSEFNPQTDQVITEKADLSSLEDRIEEGKIEISDIVIPLKNEFEIRIMQVIQNIEDNKFDYSKLKDYSDDFKGITKKLTDYFGDFQKFIKKLDTFSNQISALSFTGDLVEINETVKSLKDLVEDFKNEFARYKVLMMISNGKNPTSIFQELRALPKSEIEKFFRGVLSKNASLTKLLLKAAR